MLALLFCVLGSAFFVFSWEVVGICFLSISFIRICLLQQNFIARLNLIFWSNSVRIIIIFLRCVLCFLCFVTTPYQKSKIYLLNFFLLSGFLRLAFSISNVIIFYVCFEASLIPILLLIVGWGYQPERLQAGSFIILYTVGASLPLLVILVWWCLKCSRAEILIQKLVWSNGSISLLLFFIYGAFLVKLPIYSVHLWLPKAHVEAPLAGSIILAGILLKLGGYGIFLMNRCMSLALTWVSLFLVRLSIWGGLVAAFICLRQYDVKSLVAYSSVVHIGIVSAGLILDTNWGTVSALITIVAHGYCSSALFCLAYFSYTKRHTRNLPYIKGVLQLYPVLRLWWFLFCCINIAAPPTLNLVGELMVSVVLWVNRNTVAVIIGLIVFFRASYNIYLYVRTNHGFHSNYLSRGTSLMGFENLSLFLHLLPLLLLFKSMYVVTFGKINLFFSFF